MQMNGIESWVASLQAKAAEFANATQGAIISRLVTFRDKRGELNYKLRQLQSNPPPANAPASLRADYNATLTAALDAKERADWVGKIADQFTAITGLGALPALIAGVPVAVLIAGAAAATVIITNVSAMIGRYLGARQIAETASASGKDSTAALQSYYARTQSTGFFGDAAQLVWPLALAGGAYLLLSNKRR